MVKFLRILLLVALIVLIVTQIILVFDTEIVRSFLDVRDWWD